jgi:flagellar hook protein FlgE
MPAAGTYAAGDTVNVLVVSTATVTVGQTVTFEGLTRGLGGLPGNLPNGTFEIVAAGGGTFTVRMTLSEAVTLNASGNGANGGNGYDADAGSTFAIVGEQNQGSILGALGLVDSLNGTDYITAGIQQTDVLGPQYDPSGSVGENMASGDITAQFSRNVRVYDGLGSGHDIRFSFIKIATNRWAVEVHAIPETDVAVGGGFVDGQVAVGNITFNGDGTLRSVDAALTNPISISWTNGSTASEIEIDWGTAGEPFGTLGAATIGLSDGLSQFDSAYNVNFANQNGAAVGQLVSVSIDGQGVIVASYSNGQTQSLFKLPLAEFPNANGLQPVSGNVFAQTRDSGEVNLREAGTNGTGTVVSATLEQSNVDLANELTDMIVAQRAYQANTRVIKTSDELLEQLNQI